MSRALGMKGIHKRDSRAQILKYPRTPSHGELQSDGKDYPSRGVARQILGKGLGSGNKRDHGLLILGAALQSGVCK